MNRQTPMLEEDDVRETPDSLFQPLHEEFRFTLDACATDQNAKLPLYWTLNGLHQRATNGDYVLVGAGDGLSGSWAGERVWCNPPFSDIWTWVGKAHTSEAELVVMLIPSTRTEQPGWRQLVEPYRDNGQGFRTRFLPGRKHFLEDGKPINRKNKDGSIWLSKKGKPQRSSPKFGCCLLIWGT